MADESGETRRQRNARFEQESPEVDLPDQGAHVWQWFWELSQRRKTGPEPLAFADIGQWQQLTLRQLLPVELDMVLAMDDAYLRAAREDQKAARERAQQINRSP